MDYKNDYADMLKETGSHEEAYKALYEKRLKGSPNGFEPEYEAIFWFVVAERQWFYGNLLPEVKAKAMEFLNRTEHLEVWEEDEDLRSDLKKRITVLEKLKEKLNSPQPKPKKIPKFTTCPFEIGDVFVFKMTKFTTPKCWKDDLDLSIYREEYYDKYFICVLVSKKDYDKDIAPVMKRFYWCGDVVPSLEEIRKLPIMPSSDISEHSFRDNENGNRVWSGNSFDKYDENFGNTTFYSFSEKFLKKNHIGNIPFSIKMTDCFGWTYTDFVLPDFYLNHSALQKYSYTPTVYLDTIEKWAKEENL